MNTSSLAIDFQQGLSDAWSSIATFVPKLAGFLVILLIGWVVAKVVATIVGKVLERVGFGRLVERGGVERMLARSKYDASNLIAKLAYYAILLIALQLGFGVFGPNQVSDVLDGIVSWLPQAAVAIVIVVVAGAVAHAVREMIASMLGGLSYGAVAGRLAAMFVWGVGIIAALNQIGVATSVTVPILIAVLATVGGILVVGVGGGMIRPMQRRWDAWLRNLEAEMPAVKGHADAYQRGREDVSREQQWARRPVPAQQWVQEAAMTGGRSQGGYSQQRAGMTQAPSGGYGQGGGYQQGGAHALGGQAGGYADGYPEDGNYAEGGQRGYPQGQGANNPQSGGYPQGGNYSHGNYTQGGDEFTDYNTEPRDMR
ncbi:hypothetical protein [Nocardia sp. NPDC050793]|uniref:mechanosensitive ion channel family protein n=1 Tax=Nocardia sp. NPDC050793 TaxID=3155159 RepID=UPI00340C4342